MSEYIEVTKLRFHLAIPLGSFLLVVQVVTFK